MQAITAYAATLIIFTVIDLIWLGFIAKGFYRTQLAGLMADKINVAVAGLFYLVYALGILIFAVAPQLASGSWKDAFVTGALFGFFAYAVYDLTNLATLKNWPLALTIVDLAWGSLLTGMSAALTVLIVRGI